LLYFEVCLQHSSSLKRSSILHFLFVQDLNVNKGERTGPSQVFPGLECSLKNVGILFSDLLFKILSKVLGLLQTGTVTSGSYNVKKSYWWVSVLIVTLKATCFQSTESVLLS
jgi:hypothetical protein